MNLVLKNLSISMFPTSTLYEEEVDLLVSVANRFVEKYPESSRKDLKGTFRLVGRHRSDIPSEIITFDFPGGTDLGDQQYDGRKLVGFAIEQAIESRDLAIPCPEPNKSRCAETLTIQTKYGSFILGISMSPRDLGYSFLLQMAVALRQLGFSALSSDKTLNFSVDSLKVHSKDDRYEMMRLENEIWGNNFSTEEMKKWQRWHHNGHARLKHKELGFFFEELEKTS